MKPIRRARWTYLLGAFSLVLAATACGGGDASKGSGSTGGTGGGAATVAYASAWSRAFQGVAHTDDLDAHTIAVAPGGRTLVTGTFDHPIDLGDGDVTPVGDHLGGFLVALDDHGKPLWNHAFHDAVSYVWLDALDTDGDGNAALVGKVSGGSVDVGGGGSVGPGTFVASFAPDGSTRWSENVGDLLELNDVAATPDGHVIGVGTTGGASVLGMSVGGDPAGDGFVFELDASGQLAWVKALGGGGQQHLTLVTVAPDGAILVGGDTNMDLALGSSTVNGKFVAELDASGEVVWAHALTRRASGIAVDSKGRVVVATTDLNNAEIVGLDADGAPTWSHSLHGMAQATALDVAVDASDRVLVTGKVAVHLEVDDAKLDASGSGPYLLVLDPSGGVLSARIFDDDFNGQGEALAVMKDGTLALKGTFGETLDLGSGPLTANPNAAAVFVAGFTPGTP